MKIYTEKGQGKDIVRIIRVVEVRYYKENSIRGLPHEPQPI